MGTLKYFVNYGGNNLADNAHNHFYVHVLYEKYNLIYGVNEKFEKL